ncbi:serine hydrolase [Streptomyces sp. NPDC091292]|uniref:serine hydrolase n=1 Tax=Streptomyces sp. NPDC091292 TaxID=3365991 RepID=UPI003800031C
MYRHRLPLAACAFATLIGSLIGCSAMDRAQAVASTSMVPTSSAAQVSAPTAGATTATGKGGAVDPDKVLAKALAGVATEGKARYSVAVASLDGAGSVARYGAGTAYDTASIVKVDILAAVLLRAQDAGRPLTAQERTHATAMIRSSDNAAANALWETIGGAKGLDAANARLGLTGTKGGAGGRWGLTRTTADDQIKLLRAVFATGTGDAVLTKASRAYVQDLMGRIAADQDWGVSAAADTDWALKNGWLPRTATGLWDINSIGWVTVNGHPYLVAVLSDGNASMDKGVALVEHAAVTAVGALAKSRV